MKKIGINNIFKSPLSLIVLAFGFAITFMLVMYVGWNQKRENRIRFDMEVKEILSRIFIRVEKYEISLVQAQAFIQSNDSLTIKQFKNYIDTTEILKRYPGIQGFGYTIQTSLRDINKYEQRMREQGFRDYIIWPKKPHRDEYFPITFLEPLDWRNRRALGFDMFSEPARRFAMERARDTGRPTTTSKVTLIQETEEDIRPGFLIYVPIFKKGTINTTIQSRRANFVGFVYAPFRSYDLFSAIFKDQRLFTNFNIYDNKVMNNESLLYKHSNSDSNFLKKSWKQFYTNQELQVAGGTYFISFSSGDFFNFNILIITGAIGCLITLLIWWIIVSSKKSEAQLQKSNIELERERIKYAAAFEKSPTAIAILRGENHIYEMANSAHNELVGRGVVGMKVREALPELENQPYFDLLDQVFKTGKAISFKNSPVEFKTSDGKTKMKYVDFVYQRIEEKGKPYGIFVQAVDTTDKVLIINSIQENEQKIQAYMESMPQIAFIANAEGTFTYYN